MSSEERDHSPERKPVAKPVIVQPDPPELTLAEVCSRRNIQLEQVARQQSVYKPEIPAVAPKPKEKPAADEPSGIFIQGLPETITTEQLFEFCKKGGIIKKDPVTDNGKPTGAALVLYLKKESVALAINLLDEAHIIPGCQVSVKQKTGKKKKKYKGYVPEKIKKKGHRIDQDKDLGWDEDDRVHIILKNLFDPTQISLRVSAQFYEELKEDVAAECNKFGDVRSVKVFERNPEGAVAVVFKDHDAAEICVEKMNGRKFDGRVLEADYYDGVTNYFVEETEEEKKARFELFEEWAEEGDP